MTSSSSRGLKWWLLGGLALLLALFVGWNLFKPRPVDMAKVMELNTRGVAHMEQFEYEKAAAEFETITRMAPDWLPGQINYAMSLFNQNKPEKIDQAIEIFKAVLKKDPDNRHAHYCLGLLQFHYKMFTDALPHFEAVTRLDPDDAGAWYHLGIVLTQTADESGRATKCFEEAYRCNPYMTGPLYNLQSRVDNEKRAEELRNQFEQLKNARFQLMPNTMYYTQQGSRYARAIGRPEAAGLPPPESAPLPAFQPWEQFTVKLAAGARWAGPADFGAGAVADLRRLVRKRFGATVITLDYNRDGRPDLFLVGAVVEGAHVRDLLLRNDGGGSFTDVTSEAGLGGARASLGCAAADFDNDGHPDLLVSGAGSQWLFHNKGDGTFEDVTARCGLDQVKDICLGAAWVDLEQDGDLDLVIARYAESAESAVAALGGGGPGKGGVAVFLNIGVPTPVPGDMAHGGLSVRFRRAPEVESLFKADGPTVALAVMDADDDIDLDALVLSDRSPAALAVNDRLLHFRRVGLEAAGVGQMWNGALVLDVDQDERSDVVLLAAGQAPLLLLNRGVPGGDRAKLYEKGPINSPPLAQAHVVDVDLDGWPDVVGLTADGKVALLHNDRAGRLVASAESLGGNEILAAVLPVDLDGDGNPDLLLWPESGGPIVLRSQGNGNQAVRVRLSGRRDAAPEPYERCNNDGIGARVTLQSGRHWSTAEVATASAGLGQSSAPIVLGLDRASLNDGVVRLRWPDMVVQAEFLSQPQTKNCTLGKDNVWDIRETNRKPTSCPLLMTWNGEQWVYVTDFLGEGSVGEMLAGGGTRIARPEESVKIEAHQLRPRSGEYQLRIAEPMDEVTYLDRLRLDVIDLPPGVDVFPDERFATGGPPPTQERLYFRERYFALRASDDRGNEVTAALRDRDRVFVSGPDYRSWIGFAGEHWVELDFGEQLRHVGVKDRLFLVLAGWTDYPFPEAIFAAKQAGVEVVAPLLERLTPDGRWESVCEVGFPAGLPRVMTRDVTGLLAGSAGRLRIRTNMQVHWDQVYLAPAIAVPAARVTELNVRGAELGYRGFLREVRQGRSPLIDYDPQRIEPTPVTHWKGLLTRYGDVTELVANADDRFVILGPGDEIAVRFDAGTLAPLPAGWSRQFVLRTWGWCKDASPFTATGGEVGPLPFRGMKQFPPGPEETYPNPQDLRRWHTRRPR